MTVGSLANVQRIGFHPRRHAVGVESAACPKLFPGTTSARSSSGSTRASHGSARRPTYPTEPRCKLFLAPFGGAPAVILRRIGFGRYSGNPAICSNCIREYSKQGVTGAEIPMSLLFADVRGSTGIGERLSPTDFRTFLGHFYEIGSKAILDHDGLVDKLVGDEIIGLFFGGVSGPHHAAAAIAAGRELIERVGRADATPSGPIPLGGGVHTGIAYVGPTGPAGAVDDFTALGDVVNTTARLASAAAAGNCSSASKPPPKRRRRRPAWNSERSTCAAARPRSKCWW